MTSTDSVVVGDVFIEYFDEHVIANILDLDVESLVPFRCFSRVLLHKRLECLLTVVDHAEGVHFAEELGVAGETGLDDSET